MTAATKDLTLRQFAQDRARIAVKMAARGASMPTPDLSRALGRAATDRERRRFTHLYADALRHQIHPVVRLDALRGNMRDALAFAVENRPGDLVGIKSLTLDVALREAPDPPPTFAFQLQAHQDGLTTATWDVVLTLDSCRRFKRGRWVATFTAVQKLHPSPAAIAGPDPDELEEVTTDD